MGFPSIQSHPDTSGPDPTLTGNEDVIGVWWWNIRPADIWRAYQSLHSPYFKWLSLLINDPLLFVCRGNCSVEMGDSGRPIYVDLSLHSSWALWAGATLVCSLGLSQVWPVQPYVPSQAALLRMLLIQYMLTSTVQGLAVYPGNSKASSVEESPLNQATYML